MPLWSCLVPPALASCNSLQWHPSRMPHNKPLQNMFAKLAIEDFTPSLDDHTYKSGLLASAELPPQTAFTDWFPG